MLYGPSGVGKSSLLLASVARALRALPERPLVVVFSSWSDAPERAIARAIAEAADIEPGALVDVATLAQTDRDVYVILDQAEEYFTYHGEGDGFDAALAALVDGPFRINVLLSLREDTLASLDRLKGAIPNLFGNVLRLDHLDRTAGRAAIVKPLERWSELEDDAVKIEDALVADVLDGVGTGRIELGPGGQGASVGNGGAPGIEAPYLQLVMQRLWDVERSNGSATLRAETLAGLGGAGQVVADHLERAIEALTPDQRDMAALLFDHLVTPSGTKIAHETSDLAQFAGASEDEVRGVLAVLAEHRILRTDEAGRWEIFHDVLAGAVLGWKTPARRGAGGSAGKGGGTAAPPPPGVPHVRGAPRARGHRRARRVRVLPAHRGARSGASGPGRPARRGGALGRGHRSRARHRARPRGGSARGHTESRGCAPSSPSTHRGLGRSSTRGTSPRDGSPSRRASCPRRR